jgi:hypothetical protein
VSKFFSTCDSSRLSKSFVEIVEKVCEVSYESVSPGPEPSQTILQESPFGDSPNTIEHRNLVNRQLATLEHRMAHRQPQRDPSQPTFNVPHHFRQAVRRESVVSNMPGHAAPPPVTLRPPPRVLPGGPDYENGFHYMVSTSITNGVPDPRWGPVPGPGEMTGFSLVSCAGVSIDDVLLTANSSRESLLRLFVSVTNRVIKRNE